MPLTTIALGLAVVAAALIIRTVLRSATPAQDFTPETQDDIARSMARWGYLHDKRRG